MLIDIKSDAVNKFCRTDIWSSAKKNYYCLMRDQLKTALGKQILLDDGRKFQYVITMVEVMNALGAVAAVLDEYLITGEDGLVYKLYKTKEGNWYDADGQSNPSEQIILQRLKRAIDAHVIEVSE